MQGNSPFQVIMEFSQNYIDSVVRDELEKEDEPPTPSKSKTLMERLSEEWSKETEPYDNDKPTCAICLEIYTFPITGLLSKEECSHSFCQHCISTWLKTHVRCPTCRTKVVDTYHATDKEREVLTYLGQHLNIRKNPPSGPFVRQRLRAWSCERDEEILLPANFWDPARHYRPFAFALDVDNNSAFNDQPTAFDIFHAMTVRESQRNNINFNSSFLHSLNYYLRNEVPSSMQPSHSNQEFSTNNITNVESPVEFTITEEAIEILRNTSADPVGSSEDSVIPPSAEEHEADRRRLQRELLEEVTNRIREAEPDEIQISRGPSSTHVGGARERVQNVPPHLRPREIRISASREHPDEVQLELLLPTSIVQDHHQAATLHTAEQAAHQLIVPTEDMNQQPQQNWQMQPQLPLQQHPQNFQPQQRSHPRVRQENFGGRRRNHRRFQNEIREHRELRRRRRAVDFIEQLHQDALEPGPSASQIQTRQ